jgi:hypothetical protein
MEGKLIGFDWRESDTSNARGVIKHNLSMCQRRE